MSQDDLTQFGQETQQLEVENPFAYVIYSNRPIPLRRDGMPLEKRGLEQEGIEK